MIHSQGNIKCVIINLYKNVKLLLITDDAILYLYAFLTFFIIIKIQYNNLSHCVIMFCIFSGCLACIKVFVFKFFYVNVTYVSFHKACLLVLPVTSDFHWMVSLIENK